MKAAKRKRLEDAVWSVGSATDFLELPPEDATFIELKLRLSESQKQLHQSKRLRLISQACTHRSRRAKD